MGIGIPELSEYTLALMYNLFTPAKKHLALNELYMETFKKTLEHIFLLKFSPLQFLGRSLYFIGSKIHWVSEYWTMLSDNFIMFQYSNHEVLSNSWTLVWHSGHGLNNEPFNYQVTTDLLKTRLVCYSDHHCTKCLFFKSGP